MRMKLAAALCLGLLATASSRADDVYLTNGRSFKGVIAEVGETRVRIKMPGGELSLARSQVARVEESASAYEEYLERKQAARRSGKAADWLELARWAKANGLTQGAREAALAAAEIEPRLEGLAPILRGFGYELDPVLDRWISYAEAMRRRGLIYANGQWITREEHAELVRLRDEQSSRRASLEADQAARRTRDAALALVELELAREARRASRPEPDPYDFAPVYPGWGAAYVLPPVWVAPGPGHRGHGRHGHHGRPPFKDGGYDRLVHRQPGSLLPLDPAH